MNDHKKHALENLMNRMMISCEKATFLISKAEDEKLSCKEQYQLQVHLVGCKFCRRYRKEIHYIGKALDKVRHSTSILEKLSPEKKQNLKETLEKEIKKDR